MRLVTLRERALNVQQPRTLEDTWQTTVVMLLRLCESEPESKPVQNLSPMHGSWHRVDVTENRGNTHDVAHTINSLPLHY